MNDDDKYEAAMQAAVMPELLPLLKEQVRRFQKAALPFCDGDGPAFLEALEYADSRLGDMTLGAVETVRWEQMGPVKEEMESPF